MIKVVYCDIIRLILPYFPTVFTDIYHLFPLNSMTLPYEGRGLRGGQFGCGYAALGIFQ